MYVLYTTSGGNDMCGFVFTKPADVCLPSITRSLLKFFVYVLYGVCWHETSFLASWIPSSWGKFSANMEELCLEESLQFREIPPPLPSEFRTSVIIRFALQRPLSLDWPRVRGGSQLVAVLPTRWKSPSCPSIPSVRLKPSYPQMSTVSAGYNTHNARQSSQQTWYNSPAISKMVRDLFESSNGCKFEPK